MSWVHGEVWTLGSNKSLPNIHLISPGKASCKHLFLPLSRCIIFYDLQVYKWTHVLDLTFVFGFAFDILGHEKGPSAPPKMGWILNMDLKPSFSR